MRDTVVCSHTRQRNNNAAVTTRVSTDAPYRIFWMLQNYKQMPSWRFVYRTIEDIAIDQINMLIRINFVLRLAFLARVDAQYSNLSWSRNGIKTMITSVSGG